MANASQLPLVFLYGTHVSRCSHHIHKHFEDYSTLQYMHGGGVSLSVDSQLYALRGQWFWSCFPGPLIQFHALAPAAHWNHRYLAFRGPLLERWRAEGLFPVMPQRARKPELAVKLVDQLLGLARRRDRLGRLRAVNALEALLLLLAEARSPATPLLQDSRETSAPWLSQSLLALDRFIEPASPEEVPSYAAVAEAAGMSLTHFRRRFKQAVGIAPHHYLLHQRIDAAKKLLAETSLPIKTIARRLGYRDVFFFSRQFRALADSPPATYRRSVQG